MSCKTKTTNAFLVDEWTKRWLELFEILELGQKVSITEALEKVHELMSISDEYDDLVEVLAYYKGRKIREAKLLNKLDDISTLVQDLKRQAGAAGQLVLKIEEVLYGG